MVDTREWWTHGGAIPSFARLGLPVSSLTIEFNKGDDVVYEYG